MDYQPQPKKTNWLLWGSVLGGVLIVTPIACCAGFGFLGFNAAKAPLEAAAKSLESDERVTSVIGSPIKYDNLVMTGFQIDNGKGSAGLDTDFSGPNGTVHVKGSMALENNSWSPGDLTVTFEDETEITIP